MGNKCNSSQKICLYCGKNITKEESVVVLNKKQGLYVCSENDCRSKAELFIARDQKYRLLMYFFVGVLVFPLMFFYVLGVRSKLNYVLLLMICILMYIFPFPFTNYKSYEYYGIHKTTKIVHTILLIIVCLSFANLIV